MVGFMGRLTLGQRTLLLVLTGGGALVSLIGALIVLDREGTIAPTIQPAAPHAALERWLDMARIGDYATARTLTNDPDLAFGVWQARTEAAVRAGYLKTATIMHAEQRGATTAYTVQWAGAGRTHCQLLLVDDQGNVSALYPYLPQACPAQGLDA